MIRLFSVLWSIEVILRIVHVSIIVLMDAHLLELSDVVYHHGVMVYLRTNGKGVSRDDT